MAKTINKIASFLSEELLHSDVEQVSYDDSLIELGLDSLRMMRLAGFLEKEFCIKIEDEDIILENFVTISAIKKLVDKQERRR